MRRLLLIGMGTGDPDHLTVQAIAALRTADVFFVLDKGELKQDLAQLRRRICERFLEQGGYRVVEIADPVRDPTIADYQARVDAWHRERATRYAERIRGELGEHGVGAFLVWGDPSLYDSTLRIVEQVRALVAFDVQIIPGISSIQVLAARHKIALNRVGGAVHITTGRRLRAGVSPELDDLVVMLDGECSFQTLPAHEWQIFWGAYLGSAQEMLIAGPLAEVGAQIVERRTAARSEHGWLMDVYLLRRIVAGQGQARET